MIRTEGARVGQQFGGRATRRREGERWGGPFPELTPKGVPKSPTSVLWPFAAPP
jgi:hypothetical protein